jgi:hypothetical protein
MLPVDAEAAGRLAVRHTTPELGELVVRTTGAATVFLREWHSTVASGGNEGVTIPFVSINPG